MKTFIQLSRTVQENIFQQAHRQEQTAFKEKSNKCKHLTKLKTKKWVNALWCSLVWRLTAWYLMVSHLLYKFINVRGKALSWRNPQDWVKVLISATAPVWCFVQLHQWEQSFAQVCAAKHRERLSSFDAQLGHCVGNEAGKLSSTSCSQRPPFV